MPAQKTHYLHVNLLPKDAFAESTAGKLLSWSLSTGRYIVIFTEMIVILTFLSRFTLDRQLSDLNESLLRKQNILQSFAEPEAQIREIQQKAEFLLELDGRMQAPAMLAFLDDNAPSDIIFERLELRADRFSLVGVAYSQVSLSSFIDRLKAEEGFTDVILDKVSTTENSSGINFIIRANLIEEEEDE